MTYPLIFQEGFELAAVEMSKTVIKYRESKGWVGKIKIENQDWEGMLAQLLKGSLGLAPPYQGVKTKYS